MTKIERWRKSLRYPPADGRVSTGLNAKGSVLCVSLWMLLILSIFALGIGYRLSLELKFRNYQIEQLHLQGLIDSGITLVKLVLDDDKNSWDERKESWANNPRLFKNHQLDEGEFSIVYQMDDNVRAGNVYGIIDEESKININTAPYEVLLRIFGMNANVVNAILDWRDKDNDIRIGGAEDDYYGGGKHYVCKNGDLGFLEELMLVKGIDGDIFSKTRDLITVYGNGRTNINTASKEVLKVLGVQESIADAILSFRRGIDGIEGTEDDNIFEDVAIILEELGKIKCFSNEEIRNLGNLIKSNALCTNSTHFTIKLNARLSTGAAKEVVAVMDRKSNRIRFWNE